MTIPAVLVEVLLKAERRGDEPRYVLADEVARWPAGVLDSVKASGLLSGSADAEVTACDECLEPHVEHVQYVTVAQGSRVPAIYCPANGMVLIGPHRLRRWRINLRQFATSLGLSRDPNAQVREVNSRSLLDTRVDRTGPALWCSLSGSRRELAGRS